MSQQKKNNQAGFAVACWILIALVLLIIFLIKQDDIMRVLKDTGFFKHTIGKEPNFISQYEPKTPPEGTADELTIQIPLNTEPAVPTAPSTEVKTETEPPLSPKPAEKTAAGTPDSSADSAGTGTQPVEQSAQTERPAAEPVQPAVLPTKLCFVTIDGDGSVSRREMTRNLPKNDSPLTAALNALLSGPDLSELEKGCMTLIPDGTRLLSAAVKNKVATLNFSEEFEYNRYGVEGYLGQLMQVVYTAAAFPTVESVQFLIEGQRKEYIGSEGVWIGTPLSSTSFK